MPPRSPRRLFPGGLFTCLSIYLFARCRHPFRPHLRFNTCIFKDYRRVGRPSIPRGREGEGGKFSGAVGLRTNSVLLVPATRALLPTFASKLKARTNFGLGRSPIFSPRPTKTSLNCSNARTRNKLPVNNLILGAQKQIRRSQRQLLRSSESKPPARG